MDDAGTLVSLLERNAHEHADLAALVDGDRTWTYAEWLADARAVAIALRRLGVDRGTTVGLMLRNQAEHVIADMAALLAGATPTSFYFTLAPDQLAWVANDAGCSVAIVAHELLETWQQVHGSLPALEQLVVVDAPPGSLPDGMTRWEDVLAEGRHADDLERQELDDTVKRIEPDDALTIVYTSGTTGPPKGTIITHRGVRFVMDAVLARIEQAPPEGPLAPFARDGQVVIPAGLSALSYLPLAHMAERIITYYFGLATAMTVSFARDFSELRAELPRVRPHVFLAVPRVWEKFHDAIREAVDTSPAPRRQVGRTTLAVARGVGAAQVEGRRPAGLDRVVHRVLGRLVHRRLRAAIGLDRCILAISGAAPITVDLLAFWRGLGITIVEGYGMTESSAIISLNDIIDPVAGSVGQPLAGIEVRLADDGEILARGPNVTPGYRNRPEATAEAVDADGWLHTGDIGTLDDGRLRVTGRKKELIINAAGKNMSPVNIELAIETASPLIANVCAIGDRRPYVVALVALDEEPLAGWATARGIDVANVAAAARHPDVLAEVERAVAAGNERLSRVEQVKRWRLLDHPWTVASGMVTPTLKLKRRVVEERYADQVEELYA